MHHQAILSLLFLSFSLLKAQDLTFQFAFDKNQVRLGNLGEPSNIAQGNAAQTPVFQRMSVHYIELAPSPYTQLGEGAVLYHAPETTLGGESAIDDTKSIYVGEDQIFLRIPLSQVPAGTYKYVRASVAYQEYKITYNLLEVEYFGDVKNIEGTIASYVGFLTYVTKVKPASLEQQVNANRRQGFFGFDLGLSGDLAPFNTLVLGEAPEGATTVVNPLAATSPIPPGSCVVTGELDPVLVIDEADRNGSRYQDVRVTLSFSVNQSFEWVDANGNGQWDLYTNSSKNEKVVDMGLRGLVPVFAREPHTGSASGLSVSFSLLFSWVLSAVLFSSFF